MCKLQCKVWFLVCQNFFFTIICERDSSENREATKPFFFLNSIRLDFEVYASTTLTLQYPEFKGSDSWLFIVCTVKQLIEHYLFVLTALTAVIKNKTTGKKKNTQNTLVLSAALPLELPLLIFVK